MVFVLIIFEKVCRILTYYLTICAIKSLKRLYTEFKAISSAMASPLCLIPKQNKSGPSNTQPRIL